MVNSLTAAGAMSPVEFSMQYAVSVTKSAMEVQESAAQNLLKMLPSSPTPAIPKGQFIDVYA